jgi:hypothetical protein
MARKPGLKTSVASTGIKKPRAKSASKPNKVVAHSQSESPPSEPPVSVRPQYPPQRDRAGQNEHWARLQVLSDWRRQHLDGQEPVWHSEDRSASTILDGVLKKLRLEERLAESQLIQIWNKTLDPALTAHAQPVGLRNGTLFVNVSNHVWLSELVRYRREEVLERVQLACGKTAVQRISFRLG